MIKTDSDSVSLKQIFGPVFLVLSNHPLYYIITSLLYPATIGTVQVYGINVLWPYSQGPMHFWPSFLIQFTLFILWITLLIRSFLFHLANESFDVRKCINHLYPKVLKILCFSGVLVFLIIGFEFLLLKTIQFRYAGNGEMSWFMILMEFMIATLLCSVLYLYLLLSSWLAIPLILVEDPGMIEALKRSRTRMNGWKRTVLGIEILFFAPCLFFLSAIGSVSSSPFLYPTIIVFIAYAIFVFLLTAGTITVLYYKSGSDLPLGLDAQTYQKLFE